MNKKELRKDFEEWFEADAMPLEHSNWFGKDEDGDYLIDYINNYWQGWKAAYNKYNK